MTTLTPAPPADTTTTAVPRRRNLVALAVAVLVTFVVAMANGSDNEPTSSLSTIASSYDYSKTVLQLMAYSGMVLCALLVFLGVAVRNGLRSRGGAWTADVAMLGFVVIGLTLAGWTVSALSMWHAVDQGEDASIRTLNFIDTGNFLPLMMGMVCVYAGSGLAGLTTGTLPKWLAVTSIGLGILSPLGPLAFAPAMLLPLWIVVVAATVRLGSD